MAGWNSFVKDAQSAVGGKGSVGVACVASTNGLIIINALQPGGAAAKSAKVAVSDIILEIDGKPCVSSIDVVSDQLRGAVGSKVALKLKRRGLFGEDVFSVSLTRIDLDADKAEAKKKKEAELEAKSKAEKAKLKNDAEKAKKENEKKEKAAATMKNDSLTKENEKKKIALAKTPSGGEEESDGIMSWFGTTSAASAGSKRETQTPASAKSTSSKGAESSIASLFGDTLSLFGGGSLLATAGIGVGLQNTDTGILISDVSSGGPASGKLQKGDVLFEVDKKKRCCHGRGCCRADMRRRG